MSGYRRLGATVVILGAVIAPACGESANGDRGSETHWLDDCDSDEGCKGGLRCVCGSCTLTCTENEDCRDLGGRAACASPTAVNALCPSPAPDKSLCLASCATVADCARGLPCLDGVCATRATAEPKDASAPASGSDAGDGSPRDARSRLDAATTDGGPIDGSASSAARSDSGATMDSANGAHDGAADREDGAAHPSAPDGGTDAGNVQCRDGFHVVSTGDCRPILFADDFQSGNLPGPWQLWRRTFAEVDGRIQVADAPRPGFNYGAGGNGRSALLATHIGDPTWTDYRLDFDAEVLPAGTFDPYSLSPCTRRFSFYFRSQQQTESWNDPMTSYSIGVETKTCDQDIKGTVSMATFHGYYCPGIGWGCSTAGEGRALVDTNTAALVDGPNHYTVEVVGNEVKFWVNGTAIFDYVDDKVPYPAGASPITSGGVTLEFVWELMGWADNFVVTDMR